MSQDAESYYEGPSPEPPKQHVSARVPPSVSPGIFSTGTLVMTGNTEFILDFVQNLGHAPQVAARIVMPHATMPQFIAALEKNLENFKGRFGEPAELPANPPQDKKPTLQEIYDEVKIDDRALSGSYANGVMIAHGPSEFKFDFLANVVPHPAVSSRVYLSAQRVPRLLESLKKTYEQFQNRLREQKDDPPGEPV